jgi:hypothetical protein
MRDRGEHLRALHAASAALRWYNVVIPRDATSALGLFDLSPRCARPRFSSPAA